MDPATCRRLSFATLTQMATWPDLSDCRTTRSPAAYLLPWEQGLVQNFQTVPAAKFGLYPLDTGQDSSNAAEVGLDSGTRQSPANAYLQSSTIDGWSLKLLNIGHELPFESGAFMGHTWKGMHAVIMDATA